MQKNVKSLIFAHDLKGEGANLLPLFYKDDMIEEKLLPVIDQKLSEEGFEDCYLVDIVIRENTKVFVYVDCDSGIPIRKCVSISRRIEHYLDETLLIGEKYTLEVSSPGLDKPLVRRQYKKNIGRGLKVKFTDYEMMSGTLMAVDEFGITLETSEKNKKKQIDLKFEEILESKVIIKFNKKKK